MPTDSYGYTYDQNSYWSDGHHGRAQDNLKTRIAALEEDFQAALKARKGKRMEVMVFVHGGLNSQADAIKSAGRIKDALAADGRSDIFPVFITWDSELFSTYGWHLRRDSNGIADIDSRGYTDDLRSIPRVPVLLASDLATGVATAPKTFYNATGKAIQNWDWAYSTSPGSFPTRRRYEETLNELAGRGTVTKPFSGPLYHPGKPGRSFEFSVGAAHPTFESNASAIASGAMLPLSTMLSPVYDGIGKPAWKNMLRRSKTLVYRNPTFVENGGKSARADGVVPEILRRIATWQKRNPSLQLSFVGHSMGTIVLNETFRAMESERGLPAPVGCDVRVDRVIYLAAACSIRDFNDSLGRYMHRNSKCEVYCLALHPKREVGEKFAPALPLVFSGSLLTWIDEFFQNPVDFQERTFGSFENCILANRLLPEKPTFHLKAFEENESFNNRLRPESGPQKHGEMAQFCFWDPWFYQPAKPGSQPRPYRTINSVLNKR